MTSPPTVPYTMPEAASLPACGPAWSIDPRRSALLVQHVQKYLLRLLHDSAPVGELLSNVGRLTHSARSAGVPVVYVARAPGPAGARKGAPGPVLPGPPAEAEVRAFADVVQPQAGDTVLTAKRYSAFAGTRLRARLNELGRDQLVVVGALARTDVLLTAADAWMQDLQPFVVIDAVVDTTAADHAMAVHWLAATCAAVTVTGPVADTFRGGRVDAAAG
ncbi:isochorismatase family protein [Streptomyces blattellae]|uniref:isochorismatase family protein n=1 Tax=Streptomyces blattellae TaxID=2569855 RepID=UPI0012B8A2E7|nr:isochorismatase family protein [Streptomyces blattellae]